MKHANLFTHLGLTENEGRVYKALLHLGPSSVTQILERAKLHRPSVYRALKGLTEQHLVTPIPKGKRTHYAPASPSLLKGRIRDEMETLEQAVTPLEYLYEKRPQRPLVRLIEGKRAIAHAYLSIPRTLKKGDIYYRYSARDVVRRDDQIDKRVVESYRKERDSKELERYVITSSDNYKRKKPELTRDMKMVPPEFDLFDHDVSQVIYGHNVLIIDYNSNTALHIENPAIAHFHRRVFELLFKLLP